MSEKILTWVGTAAVTVVYASAAAWVATKCYASARQSLRQLRETR